MTIKNKFITFEGGEGAGKSTQIKAIATHLITRGFEVVITREPGGTRLAEKLRDIVVKDNDFQLSPQMELAIIVTARLHHLENLIIPALKAGKFVLCDRYVDSTYVYQGYCQGIDSGTITELHKNILGDKFILPFKTFFINVNIQNGLKRSNGVEKGEDRFENKALEFHQKIKAGFEQLRKQNPNRIIEIDGENDVETVASNISIEMDKILNE